MATVVKHEINSKIFRGPRGLKQDSPHARQEEAGHGSAGLAPAVLFCSNKSLFQTSDREFFTDNYVTVVNSDVLLSVPCECLLLAFFFSMNDLSVVATNSIKASGE